MGACLVEGTDRKSWGLRQPFVGGQPRVSQPGGAVGYQVDPEYEAEDPEAGLGKSGENDISALETG